MNVLEVLLFVKLAWILAVSARFWVVRKQLSLRQLYKLPWKERMRCVFFIKTDYREWLSEEEVDRLLAGRREHYRFWIFWMVIPLVAIWGMIWLWFLSQ